MDHLNGFDDESEIGTVVSWDLSGLVDDFESEVVPLDFFVEIVVRPVSDCAFFDDGAGLVQFG